MVSDRERQDEAQLDADLRTVANALNHLTPADRTLETPPESIWHAIQAEVADDYIPDETSPILAKPQMQERVFGVGDVLVRESVLRIGEVSRRTGLSREKIRTWEQRYGIIEPIRNASGQRLYRERDVHRLQAVEELSASGLTIPAAAEQLERYEAQSAHGEEMLSTGSDLESDGSEPGASGPDEVVVDVEALSAIHRATRAMLHAENAADISAVLVRAVEHLGGHVGPAEVEGGDVLPVDLSLGEGDPLLPRAEPFSVARMRLEALLPTLVEDARTMLALLE